MSQIRNMTILIVVATMLLQTSEAEDYIVGGDVIGWTSFPPGVFNYESGSHSVAILNKANYEKCNINDKNIQTFNIGPTKITLDRIGDFYFSCTLSGHCTGGQKLSVKVTDTASYSSIPPAEAPSSTGPGATTLPPQSSAASMAATSSLLLITIAFNFLSQI
ncbi:hypothetical protein TSUD_207300 [Trifolium subterraneum]|uniref:Phytocyanin domain-containing protein n=1 Tax=Trifolium subterraneum TaxID=3900 RepID=A0A2Z6MWL4_TRISU|nr:hypothetical protein TSUD_207300 [Trifolium subterraneum]